jgi:hypothetical protein
MPRIISQAEIERLLAEPKKLPRNWEARLKPTYRDDSVQGRRTFKFDGDNGTKFCINVRDNQRILLDFSIILQFIDSDKCGYILTRFNGKHPSEHTNKYERKHALDNAKFRNRFHVHYATERYQTEGFPIDGYAETTNRYYSFDSALRVFVNTNGFYIDGSTQDLPLFDDDDQ